MNADGPNWVWDFPLHDSKCFQVKDRLRSWFDQILARDVDNEEMYYVPI